MPGKVSVIIPVYKSEKFIAETLRSVLCQTYADLEVLIIADGSTDATESIVRGFSDPRIKYIRRKNGGTAAARNTGIKAATGSYIAFLDHDDIWMPDKVEKQIKFLSDTGAKVVFCNGNIIPTGKPMRKENIFQTGVLDMSEMTLNGGNFITPSSLLVHKEVIEKTGPMEENVPGIDDLDFSISIARSYKIGFINECLYHRREHKDNLTNFIRGRGLYYKIIYEKQKPFLGRHQKKVLRKAFSKELLGWARKNMSFLRPYQGLESWAYSVRFRKSMILKLPGLLVRYLRFRFKKARGSE